MSSDDETIFAGHEEAGDGAGELRPGTRVGDYAVERFLGAGAMGEVYLARQVILDQECALKIMPRELSQSPDFERRFGIEGRALAKLNHPSIVRVLYAGQAEGQHYLTMEYVDGGSIEEMLAARGGRLDEDTVRTILSDMLSALDYAHTKGIVHRDLKPANILMTSEGRCKISDFGLALVAGEQFMQSVVQRSIAASQLAGYSPRHADADATRVESGSKGRSRSSDASSYVGTIDYMSPEVRAGGAADARSDIFAMGVLSYQILTGRKPLGMARPPSSIVKTLSPAWDEWVGRCMEFDAADRFQTAAEALAALPRPGLAAQAVDTSPVTPVAAPTSGRLAITSTPSGAKVSGEDGSIYGVTPLYIEGAEAGRYVFNLSKQGHEPASVSGVLAPGQTLTLDAALKPVAAAAKPSRWGAKAFIAILIVLAIAAFALIEYNSRPMTPEALYELARQQLDGGELNEGIANLYGLANWDEADPALRKNALNDWAWGVYNRASQSADQGRYQDVRSDCQSIIDEPVPADIAQQARDLLAHASRPGGIVADSEPVASVQIDGFGELRATPALFTDVPPGEYTLVFLADGHRTETRQIVVQPGQETVVPTVYLVREMGRLSVDSNPPGVPWSIANGPDDAPPSPDGAVTPDLVDLPSGVYTVTFSRPGWPEWTEEVHVPVDATAVMAHRFVAGSMNISATDPAMKWTIVSVPSDTISTSSGNVPAKIGDLAPGDYIVEFAKPGMPPFRVSAQVIEGETCNVVGRIATGTLVVESVPTGATVKDSAGNVLGKTPLRIDSAIAGEQNLTLSLAGYRNTPVSGTLAESDTLRLAATLLAVAIPEPSKPWRIPSCNLEMIWIPSGSFQMGSRKSDSYRSDDEEFHLVRITSGFWIGKFEVTQKQWMAVMGENPSRFSGAGPNAPVDSITWEMANEFCRRLNKSEGEAGALPDGYEYQLPTEAQWEYACRGGVTNRSDLYIGELKVLGTRNAPALNLIAWYSGNSGADYDGAYDTSDWDERQYSSATSGPHPVGRKRANAYGLCDMLGNVNEWCYDWYGPYPIRTATDPKGPDSGEGRVTRGGNWYCDASFCRMSSRFYYDPESKGDLVGLRLVLARKR